MSIKTEITRLQNAKASIKTAIEGKGVAVPDGTKLDGMAALVDSISSGGSSPSETWVLNLSGFLTSTFTGISFVSNGETFSSIAKGGKGPMKFLKYDNTNVCGATPCFGDEDVPGIAWEIAMWVNTAYRKLTFSAPPSGDLLTWLEANAVKQANDTAVQTDKAITITSNGTTEITPDAPYDALKKVDVTVNVASGGGGGAGFKMTFPATATYWDAIDKKNANILLADGTFKSVADYSTIGGKTIENVAGIMINSNADMFVLRMTLSAGGIAQFQLDSGYASYVVTTAPNATVTPYYAGRNLFWWPVADTVISAIEMYNTD